MKLQDMKLLHILVVLLCYMNDNEDDDNKMFTSLLRTNCFDELFFAFVSGGAYNTISDILLNSEEYELDELFVCE